MPGDAFLGLVGVFLLDLLILWLLLDEALFELDVVVLVDEGLLVIVSFSNEVEYGKD
jgi:hypothetical protein